MGVYNLFGESLIDELAGLKVSIMGDSISSYIGYVPEGYAYYYNGNNSGVNNVNQMWFNVLCDKLKTELLMINAYSGSAVTQLEDSAHVNRIPMSSNERCSNMGIGSTTPDIIIIQGGLNDYTYALSEQSEPIAWNGKTAATEGANFTETYACMIRKLQNNYPNCIIVCLSTTFSERGVDNGFTYTHSVGNRVYTQNDYDMAIKSVCEKMHAVYLDLSNTGFNRFNFYPTYAIDSNVTPTHPNATGQYVLGKAIADKLPYLIKGFK